MSITTAEHDRYKALQHQAVENWYNSQIWSEIFEEIQDDVMEYLSEEEYAEYQAIEAKWERDEENENREEGDKTEGDKA